MYSREQRMTAIKLYIKYDKSIADVICELGYPVGKSLTTWYAEYLEEQNTGIEWNASSRMTKYSKEQKSTAIKK
jgi:transposase-like protein